MAIQIAMQPKEIELLRNLLSEAERYLEFGAGGSTCLASEYPLERIDCVETDPEWIRTVQRQISFQGGAVQAKTIRFHFCDIGPTKEWGFPKSDDRKLDWDDYFLKIWAKIDVNPNLILIDGRFRAACAACSLIACSRDTVISIHDFYDETEYRKNYRSIERFVNIEARAENLIVCRKRVDFNNKEALAFLSTVRHDPG